MLGALKQLRELRRAEVVEHDLAQLVLRVVGDEVAGATQHVAPVLGVRVGCGLVDHLLLEQEVLVADQEAHRDGGLSPA